MSERRDNASLFISFSYMLTAASRYVFKIVNNQNVAITWYLRAKNRELFNSNQEILIKIQKNLLKSILNITKKRE
jgi:hypothetical protein